MEAMTIPQIRSELIEISHRLMSRGDADAARIAELAELTRRRKPVRRASARRAALTPELRADIIAMADAFPDCSYQEIAEAFDTSIGRVSEALAGFHPGDPRNKDPYRD